MKTVSMFVISIFFFLALEACNINPTKRAQTQEFSSGGLVIGEPKTLDLKRGYDYYKQSDEFLLLKMRKPWKGVNIDLWTYLFKNYFVKQKPHSTDGISFPWRIRAVQSPSAWIHLTLQQILQTLIPQLIYLHIHPNSFSFLNYPTKSKFPYSQFS